MAGKRKRTPAMRLSLQEERRNEAGELVMPNLHRVLYRPWLYADTPVWDKFEQPGKDQRRGRGSPKVQKSEARRGEQTPRKADPRPLPRPALGRRPMLRRVAMSDGRSDAPML